MPFHVRISTESQRSRDEVRLDLSAEELESRVLQPYREGRPIVIGGRTISPSDIQRVRINETAETSEQLLPIVREEQRRSRVMTMIPLEWYIADKGRDVTDDYIDGPPGSGIPAGVTPAERSGGAMNAAPNTKSVFVVHGRNMDVRDALFAFLRSLGLQPLEFNEAIRGTGRPSPYVGEVLNYAFDTVQAVVVLMTPDDEARLREELRCPSEPPHEVDLTGQARPNVLFEAGMAMGRDENRTVLVEVGTCRPFSDIRGRHIVRMNNSSERRQELAQRLQSAGCDVDMNGTDWHRAGDFSNAT